MRKTILIISILLTSLVAQSALFGLFGTTIATDDSGITISDTRFRMWKSILANEEKTSRYFSGNLLNRYTSATITQVTVQITIKGCNNSGCKTYDIKEVDLFDFEDDDLLPNQARNFSKKFEYYIPQGEGRYSYKVIKVKGY